MFGKILKITWKIIIMTIVIDVVGAGLKALTKTVVKVGKNLRKEFPKLKNTNKNETQKEE